MYKNDLILYSHCDKMKMNTLDDFKSRVIKAKYSVARKRPLQNFSGKSFLNVLYNVKN